MSANIIGRVVHYFMADSSLVGQFRPAIVVHADADGTYTLNVFTRGAADGQAYSTCPVVLAIGCRLIGANDLCQPKCFYLPDQPELPNLPSLPEQPNYAIIPTGDGGCPNRSFGVVDSFNSAEQ